MLKADLVALSSLLGLGGEELVDNSDVAVEVVKEESDFFGSVAPGGKKIVGRSPIGVVEKCAYLVSTNNHRMSPRYMASMAMASSAIGLTYCETKG